MSCRLSVQVVVVDDSTTSRTLLVAVLKADPGIDVVGEAATGAEALRMIHVLHPSVVVMDIEMPDMDGFEASKRIMSEVPTPIVIVTASRDPRDVALSLQATRVGALSVQPKPPAPDSPSFGRESRRLAAVVKAMADVKVVRRRQRDPAKPRSTRVVSADHRRLAIMGVVASTGGPAALFRFLGALPSDLSVPVLVVQHIAEGFVPGLVRWLATATAMDIKLAEHGERLRARTVYVAPDGVHLTVGKRGVVVLDGQDPVLGLRPSGSVLLASLAAAYGPAAAGVILTGMGRDGLDGARRLHASGGWVLAQDEQTSTVFGMPRVVQDEGLAHVVGSVEELALQMGAILPTDTGEDDVETRS